MTEKQSQHSFDPSKNAQSQEGDRIIFNLRKTMFQARRDQLRLWPRISYGRES
ncbi:hypothetical protein STRDD11_00455 [Streptococcus sp. DD11]|nr:hypothetical protein STRDD11_00455 [Streptococcus sp. DD11]